MSDGKKYYCFCSSNCKYETMTKEQILTAIANAVKTGSVGDCDTGFITKVKEKNNGSSVTFWVGSTAQYNALETKEVNCMYILTDETTGDDLVNMCNAAIENTNNAAASAGEAAQAAIEARDAAAGYKSINFTNAVALSWVADSGGQSATMLNFIPRRYEYNPITGLVHFAFTMQYRGKLMAGDIIRVAHTEPAGGNNVLYKPDLSIMLSFPISASTNGSFCTAEYVGDADGKPYIQIRVNENVDAEEGTFDADFCGWYFYGENNVVG